MIDNPDDVRRVVEYIDGQRAGWGGMSGWAGIPVPRVTAELYDGSEFKGHFGVGPGFFECHRDGDFSSKSIGAEQEQLFLERVGLPNTQLK